VRHCNRLGSRTPRFPALGETAELDWRKELSVDGPLGLASGGKNNQSDPQNMPKGLVSGSAVAIHRRPFFGLSRPTVATDDCESCQPPHTPPTPLGASWLPGFPPTFHFRPSSSRHTRTLKGRQRILQLDGTLCRHLIRDSGDSCERSFASVRASPLVFAI